MSNEKTKKEIERQENIAWLAKALEAGYDVDKTTGANMRIESLNCEAIKLGLRVAFQHPEDLSEFPHLQKMLAGRKLPTPSCDNCELNGCEYWPVCKTTFKEEKTYIHTCDNCRYLDEGSYDEAESCLKRKVPNKDREACGDWYSR